FCAYHSHPIPVQRTERATWPRRTAGTRWDSAPTLLGGRSGGGPASPGAGALRRWRRRLVLDVDDLDLVLSGQRVPVLAAGLLVQILDLLGGLGSQRLDPVAQREVADQGALEQRPTAPGEHDR